MTDEIFTHEKELGLPFAPLSKRIVAYIIDRVILYTFAFIILIIFSSVIIMYLVSRKGSDINLLMEHDLIIQVTFFIFGLILEWLYYSLYESSSKQATPGKSIMGIMVTDLNGNRISFTTATIRFFSKLLCYITLLVGFFMALYTPKRQALHDLIAKTIVIVKYQ